MEIEKLGIVAVVGVISGVMSGISGGGGGMLMIPAFIILGLPPQNAVATGKMNGIGASFGGLSAFRKGGYIRKDIVRTMAPIAITIGLLLPFIFDKIDGALFQRLIGIVILFMIPTLFLKRNATAVQSKKHRIVGYSAYSGILAMQALFGSGVGSLANFVLTLLFGTSKLEANATKRAITAILVPITFVTLLIGGYVILSVGIVGMISMFIGTRFGSKIAIKKGEQFATISLAIVASISAVLLISNA